jgi:uncharacterized protein YjcR
MASMKPHAQIVADAGTAEEIALRCGVSVHTVRSWQQRDSIPPDMWAIFVDDGKTTLDELVAGVQQRKRKSDAQDAA